jgi:Glycosyl transferases group 1
MFAKSRGDNHQPQPMSNRRGRLGDRLLYLGVGNLRHPRTGLDNVASAHVSEMIGSALPVDSIIVNSALAATEVSQRGQGKSWQLSSDTAVHDHPPPRSNANKLRYTLTSAFPSQGFYYVSGQARRLIANWLSSGAYGAVLFETWLPLVNVRLSQIPGQCNVFYIAHDFTPKLFADAANLESSVLRRWNLQLDRLKVVPLERRLVTRANSTIFLSRPDMTEWSGIAHNPIALVPTLGGEPLSLMVSEAPVDRTLIFVGSPEFVPNRPALNWIIEQLAPALMAYSPETQILLVGKLTEKLPAKSPNVAGIGFVSNDQLSGLLSKAAGVLSPITHGSGIKTKVLTALRLGTMVFATRESLKGLDFLALEPLIDIAAPNNTARRIAAIIETQATLAAHRRRMISTWNQHLIGRRGALNEHIRSVMSNAACGRDR